VFAACPPAIADPCAALNRSPGEYGGARSKTEFVLDASGCKSMEEVANVVRRGFDLPTSRTVQVVTITGEDVSLDTLLAPHQDLRLVLRLDGQLANFRIERVRSNLPVKGFLDDLAACQYTLLSALCELVDNSVQATRGNERPQKREIRIIMDTSHADPACRTVKIEDNGEGFSASASEEFATLGKRGEAALAGDSLGEGIASAGTFKGYFSSILSRFGMGCKMAMNLIGDQYSLRSKTRGSPVVLEASYDKFGETYQYTERHVPCAPGEEDCSWSEISIAGLQEGTTGLSFVSGLSLPVPLQGGHRDRHARVPLSRGMTLFLLCACRQLPAAPVMATRGRESSPAIFAPFTSATWSCLGTGVAGRERLSLPSGSFAVWNGAYSPQLLAARARAEQAAGAGSANLQAAEAMAHRQAAGQPRAGLTLTKRQVLTPGPLAPAPLRHVSFASSCVLHATA